MIYKPEYSVLKDFGHRDLDEEMYKTAEHFLIECISRKENRCEDSFDNLRYSRYHGENFKLELDTFPCTTAALRYHIQRAYFQCRLWIYAATRQVFDLDPLKYGFEMIDEFVMPVITNNTLLPSDFPTPCTCLKCATKKCKCRVLKIECCDFCSCHKECSNPKNKKEENVTNEQNCNSSKKKVTDKKRRSDQCLFYVVMLCCYVS